jgi:hypothetical protein
LTNVKIVRFFANGETSDNIHCGTVALQWQIQVQALPAGRSFNAAARGHEVPTTHFLTEDIDRVEAELTEEQGRTGASWRDVANGERLDNKRGSRRSYDAFLPRNRSGMLASRMQS